MGEDDGYDDDYMLDSLEARGPPDRPGEDEWDPELEMLPSRSKKSRKSVSHAGLPGPPKPKGKRGRPAKNKAKS